MVDIFISSQQALAVSQRLTANVRELIKACNAIDFENGSKLTESALDDCESELILLRELFYSFYKIDSVKAKEYEALSAERLGISIEMMDDINSAYKITVPFILPNQRSKWQKYKDTIARTLHFTLSDFCRCHQVQPIMYSAVTVLSCFSHRDSAYLCDNDNKEVKDIINVLSKHLIVDDNGINCELHFISCVEPSCIKTEIYVSEQSDFPRIYRKIKNDRMFTN